MLGHHDGPTCEIAAGGLRKGLSSRLRTFFPASKAVSVARHLDGLGQGIIRVCDLKNVRPGLAPLDRRRAHPQLFGSHAIIGGP
jgi:hypothetical protein